ncbi:hypothetical protein [uncultured Mucilaginibacter sp.]|uniref:hypothetical protein n=1 Tax=uncultured Mucilaginibacter sp. TaxID=797541 RepID=UPI000964495D|nr:hypothetical protein [uncultured Mucilaginibacter sp.]OJW17646.1 MAG: hypothetical protein BGO48_08945 [Mucilaginibacter sp. 44-25]
MSETVLFKLPGSISLSFFISSQGSLSSGSGTLTVQGSELGGGKPPPSPGVVGCGVDGGVALVALPGALTATASVLSPLVGHCGGAVAPPPPPSSAPDVQVV